MPLDVASGGGLGGVADAPILVKRRGQVSWRNHGYLGVSFGETGAGHGSVCSNRKRMILRLSTHDAARKLVFIRWTTLPARAAWAAFQDLRQTFDGAHEPSDRGRLKPSTACSTILTTPSSTRY
ncbi:hypothetical protein HYQ46_002134 [Verticillium longisporum]|nr:hypothetical protein HYQ46_002134 [Verticillium longisporum]